MLREQVRLAIDAKVFLEWAGISTGANSVAVKAC
jgi:hypothetical protein